MTSSSVQSEHSEAEWQIKRARGLSSLPFCSPLLSASEKSQHLRNHGLEHGQVFLNQTASSLSLYSTPLYETGTSYLTNHTSVSMYVK